MLGDANTMSCMHGGIILCLAALEISIQLCAVCTSMYVYFVERATISGLSSLFLK